MAFQMLFKCLEPLVPFSFQVGHLLEGAAGPDAAQDIGAIVIDAPDTGQGG